MNNNISKPANISIAMIFQMLPLLFSPSKVFFSFATKKPILNIETTFITHKTMIMTNITINKVTICSKESKNLVKLSKLSNKYINPFITFII